MIDGILPILALAAATAAAPPEARVFSPQGGLERREIRETADGVAVPLAWLESAFSLETKRLPSGETGLCRGETCVPLPVHAEGGERFVPLAPIVSGFGATLVYDAAARELLLDVPATAAPASPGADAGLGGPLDFVLPDLEGRPRALSSFRGKKVVLFAWASW